MADLNFTVFNGTEEIDLEYLRKLGKSIDQLIHLEQTEEDENSTKLHDARTNVKRRLKGACIDFGINREFVDSYLKIHTK